jgi:6-phosphogluconolactonase (cycloisomerase 2 family)
VAVAAHPPLPRLPFRAPLPVCPEPDWSCRTNGGNNITVVPGSTSFSFPEQLTIGQGYNVSVLTAPASPVQSCAITNGTGEIQATMPPITVACSVESELAIAVNSQSSNIYVYAVDPATGSLSPVPGSPFATAAPAQAFAIDATGHYVVAVNSGPSTVSVYSINTTTGSIAPVAGSPFAGSNAPLNVAISPTSNIAYVFNGDGTISAYSIDAASGSLTALGGSPFAIGLSYPDQVLSTAFAIAPGGGYLYYGYNYVAPIDDTVTGALGFTLNPTSGSPGAITGTFNFVATPMTIAPNGSFIYQPGFDYNNILGFSIDPATGVLNSLSGSPFAVSADELGVYAIAIDPTSSFLYVTNDVNVTLAAYTINAATGALTTVPSSPYPTGGQPNCSGCDFLPTAVSVDPSGKYVYVQSEFTPTSSIISAFSINHTNGSLTEVPGSPFND